MLESPVADSLPTVHIEHLQGLDALPRLVEALRRFEPAVLLSADGRGALYAPWAGGRRDREFWLLADARTALEWEAGRRHPLVLTFQSRDERVFARVTGPGRADRAARHRRPAVATELHAVVPGRTGDQRLLVVRLRRALGRLL